MSANIIQCNYNQLAGIARTFQGRAEVLGGLLSRMRTQKGRLRESWIGLGSDTFASEMDSTVLPAMGRLVESLQEASRVTARIGILLYQAEQEAAEPFRGYTPAGVAVSGQDGGGEGFLASVWGGVVDFATGVWDEGKDMVTGIWTLLTTDPRQTAKGLWSAVRHPGQLWEAFKKPYVEAWESGHPWQAIGRGTLFVASMFIGAKGADKAAEVAKGAKAARLTAEAESLGAKAGGLTKAAEAMGGVAEGSRAEAAYARFISKRSVVQFSDDAGNQLDHLILGRGTPDPATGFRGYIDEARAAGAKAFSLDEKAWDILNPQGGNGRVWAVNRDALEEQMRQGVSKIELRGESIEEVVRYYPDRFRAKEIDFVDSHGWEYGYQRVGNSWEKVSGIRASDTGRAAGAAVGPGLDFLDSAEGRP